MLDPVTSLKSHYYSAWTEYVVFGRLAVGFCTALLPRTSTVPQFRPSSTTCAQTRVYPLIKYQALKSTAAPGTSLLRKIEVLNLLKHVRICAPSFCTNRIGTPRFTFIRVVRTVIMTQSGANEFASQVWHEYSDFFSVKFQARQVY